MTIFKTTSCKILVSAGLAAPLISSLLVAAAVADVPHSAARVGEAAARVAALRARPGRITDAELEREAGGSGLRWSFDIAANGKTYEVGIDARDGAVLENKAEGRNPD